MKADQGEMASKFNDACKKVTDGVANVSVGVQALLGAGDQYQTITDVNDLEGDDKKSLEHVKGQVWMIDFWATWCPPCQAPMAHNVKMLDDRAADWGTDVRIIGLSIDGEKEKLTKHITEKKWEKVEHYWRSESTCSKTYSVNGVPHVMIIDKTGKIVFKGHPANRSNLEEDFDTLRKDGTITGEGCAAAEKAEGGEEPVPEGYSEMDPKELEEDIAAATAAIEELTKDPEVVEIAKTCPRAFCVLVCDQ